MDQPESRKREAPNLLLTIAYDGTDWCGWQEQAGQATVQGEVQAFLQKLYGGPQSVAGCSRTDSGVHALDQRATFRPPPLPPIPADAILRAARTQLPPSIRLLAVTEQPAGFHARHQALGKAYSYVWHLGELRSPFLARWCLPVPPTLDRDAMVAAAAELLGEHDFRAFSVVSRGNPLPDPVKRLDRLSIDAHGPFLVFTVVGTSFLYRMVRRLAGCLLAVGEGRLKPTAVAALLADSERRDLAANPGFDTLPPRGLFLCRIFYDAEKMAAYRCRQLPFLELLDPPLPQ